MPFKPIRLLLAYDDAQGLCARVVPRMKDMLEHRAFELDTFLIGSGPVPDLMPYKGIVLGTPVVGAGLRRNDPTAAVLAFLDEADGIDEKKLALFSVYRAWPGQALERLRGAVHERGGTVVVDHAYWMFAPERAEHVIPAECMIRIR